MLWSCAGQAAQSGHGAPELRVAWKNAMPGLELSLQRLWSHPGLLPLERCVRWLEVVPTCPSSWQVASQRQLLR